MSRSVPPELVFLLETSMVALEKDRVALVASATRRSAVPLAALSTSTKTPSLLPFNGVAMWCEF